MDTHANHKTRTLWMTGFLHAFTHVYNVALLPLYLLIQRDFHFASVEKATSFVTIMLLAYYLPSYPLGVLADRFSRKKLLAWGLGINALAFVGLAFAPNYCWALVAVIVAGVGGSSYHPAASSMISRLFPQDTGRALGLAGIGAGAGFFIGPLYTGWRAAMLAPSLGDAAWRRPVLEIGIAGLIMAAVFACLADEEEPSSGPAHSQSEKLFPTPALWFYFALACFLFSLRDFATAGMSSLGSLFLQKVHGFDTSHAGLAVSVLFIGSVVGNPLLGHLSDRARKRWAAVVLAVGAFLIALFPHLPAGWTIPCFVAFGFFFQASFPMIEAATMQSVPDSVRGRIFGFYFMITGLIGSLGHWVVGAEVKQMGDASHQVGSYFISYGIVALLALLSILGLPCLHAVRRREHIERDNSVLRASPSATK